MIRELSVYRCICSKCKHSWATKTHDVPKYCPKCHRITWNVDGDMSQLNNVIKANDGAPVVQSVASNLNDPLRDFIAKAQAKKGIQIATSIENAEVGNFVEILDGGQEEWRFTSDKPNFEDARVYRQQYLVQNPKQRRTVRVDEDNHEVILSVGKP